MESAFDYVNTKAEAKGYATSTDTTRKAVGPLGPTMAVKAKIGGIPATLADHERILHAALTSQAEVFNISSVPRALVNNSITELVRNHPAEIAANISQFARLGSSLVISLYIQGALKADQLVDGISTLLSMKHMLAIATYGQLIPMIKQFGAWPLAALQLPVHGVVETPAEVPGWNYKLTFGRKVKKLVLGRVLNNFRKGGEEQLKAVRLGETFNRLKKSGCVVDETFIYQALRGHSEKIGMPSEPRTQEQLGEIANVNMFIELICQDLFGGEQAQTKPLKEVLPTGSAVFQVGRAKGGGIAATSKESLTDDSTPEWNAAVKRKSDEETDKLSRYRAVQLNSAQQRIVEHRESVRRSLDSYRCLMEPTRHIFTKVISNVPLWAQNSVEAYRHLMSEDRKHYAHWPKTRVWTFVHDLRVTPHDVLVDGHTLFNLPIPSEPAISEHFISRIQQKKLPQDDGSHPSMCDGVEYFHRKEREVDDAFWEQMLLAHKNGALETDVVCILEAFKVRPITMGPGIVYLETKRFQKRLTKALAEGPLKHFFPALQGRITAETLNETFKEFLTADSEFLSGDYKGATDDLITSISDFTINRALDYHVEYNVTLEPDARNFTAGKKPALLRDVIVLGLTGHNLNYKFKGVKEWGGEEVTEEWSVKQERGQMMGSYLSFPVLNILNLAVNLAYLLRREVISLENWRQAPLIINGDDVSAAGPKGTFTDGDWEPTVGCVGFVKSLGKNYVSDVFATINSQVFAQEADGRLIEVVCPRTEVIYNRAWCEEISVKELTDQLTEKKYKVLIPFDRAKEEIKKANFTKRQQEGQKEGKKEVGEYVKIRGKSLQKENSRKRSLDKRVWRDATADGYACGPQMIGGLIRDVCTQLTDSEEKIRLFTVFLALRQEDLKRTGRAYYVPSDLGGLGLPVFAGMEKITENDARTTALLIRYSEQGKFPEALNPTSGLSTVRLCDKLKSKIDMTYLRQQGWVQKIVKNPTPELLKIHKDRPRLEVKGLQTGLVLRGIKTSIPAHIALEKSKRALQQASGKANRTHLFATNLVDNDFKMLWLPRELADYLRHTRPTLYKRDEKRELLIELQKRSYSAYTAEEENLKKNKVLSQKWCIGHPNTNPAKTKALVRQEVDGKKQTQAFVTAHYQIVQYAKKPGSTGRRNKQN
jgi:hypothetical protein